jgi:hypothetical protein
MGFNNLLNLSKAQARRLFDCYCAECDTWLEKLSEVADKIGYSLPSVAKAYNRSHLQILGNVVPAILTSPEACSMLPNPQPWLVELINSPSGTRERTSAENWVGIACSYAFQCVVLNTMNNVRLRIGDMQVRRYIHQNQPVITGRLHGCAETMDDSPLSVGWRAIKDIRDGDYSTSFFVDAYRSWNEDVKYLDGSQVDDESN